MDWRDAHIGAGVNPGWEPLVDELHRRVLEVAPEITVNQVKEKFGGLRYYYSLPVEVSEREIDDYWCKTVGEKVEKIVSAAELCSTWICEVCGEPGHTDNWNHGWLNTLCPEHGSIRSETGTPAWKQALEKDAQ